tara:strand:- start:17 stop:241 length:225 start_codon:yes stop_codon:yes gene_type:complete
MERLAGRCLLNDIAKKVINLSNSKSSIEYLMPVSDDPMQRKPDLTLAKNIIDWKPKVGIDKGISSTIDYFKNQL